MRSRVKKLEEENINVRRLGEKEEENLENLRIIESYLNRTIDEHQKILSSHFDLKGTLYQRTGSIVADVPDPEIFHAAMISMIKCWRIRQHWEIWTIF